MPRPASKRTCQVCSKQGVIRNGTTSAGKQRWRCTSCGASNTKTRSDQRELSQFTQFLAWITGRDTQSHIDKTIDARTFRKNTARCWNVPIPPPGLTGEVHDHVFLDGTYLAYGWCLLVAHASTGPVVGWQWCHSENSTAYARLLTTLPAPLVVSTDGNGGALKAIKEHWPDSKVQRCLLHVHRNNTRDLTRHPKTLAGKALIGLSKALLNIDTAQQPARWATLLAAFHTQYPAYVNERTYARDSPLEAASPGKKTTGWWYTHERDRRVYNRLNRLYHSGQLFTYLTTTDNPLDRTTNPVESINHQIKNVIKYHPGLSEPHMTCAIEWVLHSYTEQPDTPKEILKTWHKTGRPARRIIPKKPHPPTRLGPKEYNTALTAEEGLWTRKGWAGRSH